MYQFLFQIPDFRDRINRLLELATLTGLDRLDDGTVVEKKTSHCGLFSRGNTVFGLANLIFRFHKH